ncbi:MAG: type II secretion system F family protein [Phycisphaerae bacterium]
MSSLDLINSYITSIMIVLMPLAGMMLISYSAYTLWKDLRGSERKKIQQRLREDDTKHIKKIEQSIAKANKSQKTFVEIMLHRISLTRKMDQWIVQADLDMTGTKFLTKVSLATAVVFIIGLLFKFAIWKTLILAFLVFYLPIFAISFLAKRRMKKLIYQLPDVFELISQALRAGHSLASGIQLIGTQLPEPAGIEFSRVFHEQNLGIKMEEALSNFANRTNQLDIRFFVTAVLIQRQTGGDLAEILDKIGAVIQDRIKIMGQVQALTAEGRMSGWTLSALPVLVFFMAWVMNPEYAGVLLYDPTGQAMLVAAIVLQIIGMLMIKKIVNIKI